MRITVDVSPWVHHHAGLGRYAGEAPPLPCSASPPPINISACIIPRQKMELGGSLASFQPVQVPLNAKPWRMLVLLAYYAHLSFDRWLPQTDIFHGTNHLLPPLKHAREVFTIHDLIFRFFPEYHLPLNRWFLTLMLPKFMHRADAVIAVSEQTRRDVIRFMDIPSEKIVVIYEGVNPSFRPITDRALLARVRPSGSLPHALHSLSGHHRAAQESHHPARRLRRLAVARFDASAPGQSSRDAKVGSSTRRFNTSPPLVSLTASN